MKPFEDVIEGSSYGTQAEESAEPMRGLRFNRCIVSKI